MFILLLFYILFCFKPTIIINSDDDNLFVEWAWLPSIYSFHSLHFTNPLFRAMVVIVVFNYLSLFYCIFLKKKQDIRTDTIIKFLRYFNKLCINIAPTILIPTLNKTAVFNNFLNSDLITTESFILCRINNNPSCVLRGWYQFSFPKLGTTKINLPQFDTVVSS